MTPGPRLRVLAARLPRARLPRAMLPVVVLGACGGLTGRTDCAELLGPSPLPEGLEESSGVAISHQHPDLYWTIDDGRRADVHAVDGEGRLRGVLRLRAPGARDLEDLALARCGGTFCLYLADTGDNYSRRDHVTVYRVEEPTAVPPTHDASPDAFSLRFPDGPRNVEAVFVLPGEGLYLVSKGDEGPVTVYRYPPPLRSDSVVTVQEVQRLGSGSRALPRQVTGAAATLDGELVAVRTYEVLTFYRLREGRLTPVEDGEVSLRPLREPQGEAVALGPDGRVAFTSETGPLGREGSIAVLRCSLAQRVSR